MQLQYVHLSTLKPPHTAFVGALLCNKLCVCQYVSASVIRRMTGTMTISPSGPHTIRMHMRHPEASSQCTPPRASAQMLRTLRQSQDRSPHPKIIARLLFSRVHTFDEPAAYPTALCAPASRTI
ncbi:hypothetical protein FKP32DRAFT_113981 [Trametes sanguinea]|nr:hypothetical protein FKP32DRAFT_113981 [Trametes sanguinea]